MILTHTPHLIHRRAAGPFCQRAERLRWWLCVVCWCFLLILPGSGLAQENGAEGSNASVLERFGAAARQGDAVAQTNLGALYLHGVGVRRNLNKAYYWFQRAAEQEEGLAQFNLGVLCQEGQGIPRDDQKAAYWFHRVAAQSARVDQFNPVIKGWAQLKLGYIYYEGRGVAKDYREALTWFKLAAERGIGMAQEMLGLMYAQGLGTPKDEKRAFFWYEQAAHQGSRVAEKALQAVAHKLTAAQQAEARTVEPQPSTDAGGPPPSGVPAPLAGMIGQPGLPLTVVPNPPDAQVRILNIRPGYVSGMRLLPGKYHVEVTRQGYRPETLWVTVQESEVKVDVTLTPEGAAAVAQNKAVVAPAKPATAVPTTAPTTVADGGLVQPAANGLDGSITVADKKASVPTEPSSVPGKVARVPTETAVTSVTTGVAAAKPVETARVTPVVARAPTGEPAPAAVEPAKPKAVPAKPKGVSAKPVVEPAKPAVEPAKPAVEPAKPAVEPAKPAVESAKPAVVVPPAPIVVASAVTEAGVPATRPAVTRQKVATRPVPQAQQYALTVQTEPAEAQVKVLDIVPRYQPGLLLKPGIYRLEVSHPGFVTRRLQVTVGQQAVQVAVALKPEQQKPARPVGDVRRAEPVEACPEARQPALSRPRQYALTVQSDPGDAQVQILNSRIPYQPGVALPPGRYHLAIAKEAFKTRQCWANLVDRDLDLAVALQPLAPGDLHALTIQAQPADAVVRLLNIRTPYRPGIRLESGSYRVEVAKKGYKTEHRVVELGGKDRVVAIHLAELPLVARPTLTVLPVLQGVEIRIVNANVAYRPGVPLAPGRYLLELSKPGFKTQQRWVELSERDVKVEVALEQNP
ncbi:MAG: SEL1-like repeat protein [Magnetococcales bacterium]|nr:SEL1-like repeat protein [Magnetococcales bacterium]